MAIRCNDTDLLMSFVQTKHIDVEISHPTGTQTKIDFPCGLVMNIYNTGNVNFQGNSYENHTASDIVNVIEAINR